MDYHGNSKCSIAGANFCVVLSMLMTALVKSSSYFLQGFVTWHFTDDYVFKNGSQKKLKVIQLFQQQFDSLSYHHNQDNYNAFYVRNLSAVTEQQTG